MSKNPKEGGLCWACGKMADSHDNFCRFCGKDLVSFPWYYQHWGIILLTFIALGPLSIVLVWRSPVLSRTARWIYTIALAAFTYWVGLRCYQAWQLFKQLSNNLVLAGSFN